MHDRMTLALLQGGLLLTQVQRGMALCCKGPLLTHC
jgi:hypothetical protein